MRFAVEAWAPEYGSPTEAGAMAESEVTVRFAELMQRAQAGETILVERDGVAVCRLGPPGPACTLDDFTRFLERIHAQGGVREVTDSPQRLA